jgi:protein O-GlcNAc transferase
MGRGKRPARFAVGGALVWVQDVGAGSSFAAVDEIAPREEPEERLVASLEAALPAYQQIMGLDREHGPAMLLAGLIQHEKGDHAAAEWLLRRSIKVAPTVIAYNTLGYLLLGRRQWDEAIACYRASMAIDPTDQTTWPNLLFALDLHPGASWQLRLAERRRFNALHAKPLTDAALPHTNDPDPDRVLRVGYVSADFKQHSALHGFGPAVFGHHPEAVEVHLYDVDQSPTNPDDKVAEEVRTRGTWTWHDVRGYDDATLAATIRADGIDILVDLSGYSGGGRPLLFARKPAPIQVSGFGYATGLGIDAMDYMIGDDTLIPHMHAERYHERIMRLPVFMGYEKAPPWPDVASAPKERNGYTTYGYLGRIVKISPQALAAWAEILHRDPTSRMLLKGGEYRDPLIVKQISDAFSALGVDPSRLEFRLDTARFAHLEAYADVDVALDPFPHNGGVTTCEATLMGVPVITIQGGYVCGRVGVSIMNALGYLHTVARSPAEYVSNALTTGAATWTHTDRLGLRLRMWMSALMSDDGYPTAVEEAYRSAWVEWCGQQNTLRPVD